MFAAIEIGSTQLKVSPTFTKEFFNKIQKETSYRVPGCEYMPQYRYQGWDGIARNFRKDQTAPVGLYLRIKRILERAGYTVEVAYLVDYPPKGVLAVHGLTLDDFQIEVAKLAVQYRICVFSSPVRSGKTAIISATINRIDHYPVCVVTKYTDLVRQTQKAIAEHTQKPVGIFSESKFTAADIWVTSYDALCVLARPLRSVKATKRNKAILELVERTKVLLLDECQFALADKTSSAVQLFTNIGYKIGFSGTPKYDDVTTKQLEVALGPIIKKVLYKKLIDSGRIAQPRVYVYDLPMPWFDYSLDEFSDIYKCNIVNNTNRNAFIADLVSHLYATNLSSFVMVGWREHGHLLQQMIANSFFIHGDTVTSDRFNLYKAVQEREIKCLIGTVGKLGLNLPKLNAIINAEGMSSSVLTIQKMRSLTACEGKKYGFIFDFIDKSTKLVSHSMRRLQLYAKLDGFEIKLKRVPKDYFGGHAYDESFAKTIDTKSPNLN